MLEKKDTMLCVRMYCDSCSSTTNTNLIDSLSIQSAATEESLIIVSVSRILAEYMQSSRSRCFAIESGFNRSCLSFFELFLVGLVNFVFFANRLFVLAWSLFMFNLVVEGVACLSHICGSVVVCEMLDDDAISTILLGKHILLDILNFFFFCKGGDEGEKIPSLATMTSSKDGLFGELATM